VRIWVGKPQDDNFLTVGAVEARAGCVAAVADGPAGKLPAEACGLSVSRPGIAVTAFGPNPDGPGTILRIWDQAGQAGACAVGLPNRAAFKTARPCNLRGEFVGPATPIQQGRGRNVLKAFGPAHSSAVVLRGAVE